MLLTIPYDGGTIGIFKSDITRNFDIKFGAGHPVLASLSVEASVGQAAYGSITSGGGQHLTSIGAFPVGNFGNETAGASVSMSAYITY